MKQERWVGPRVGAACEWRAGDRCDTLSWLAVVEIHIQHDEFNALSSFSQGAISKNFLPLSCAYFSIICIN